MLKPFEYIVVLAALSLPAIASDDILPELKKGQPKKVKALIDRIYLCNHLAGEVGGDKESMRELIASMHRNRCEHLVADEAKILAQYKNNSKVLDAVLASKAPPTLLDPDP